MELSKAELGQADRFERLDTLMSENGYPGRWLAMGRVEDGVDRLFPGSLALAYSFGGRSDGSKDRVAVQDNDAIRLYAPNKTKEEMDAVPDADLIYYHAMTGGNGIFVVSNGAQTLPVLEAVRRGASVEDAVTNLKPVRGRMGDEEIDIDLSSYEPDTPINTPRITGVANLHTGTLDWAITRKDLDTGDTIRNFWTADIASMQPGEAWAIQTYGVNDPSDRETPVPHFVEAPYHFPLEGDATEIADDVRSYIGEATFAASVVRIIDVETGQFRGGTIVNTRG